MKAYFKLYNINPKIIYPQYLYQLRCILKKKTHSLISFFKLANFSFKILEMLC